MVAGVSRDRKSGSPKKHHVRALGVIEHGGRMGLARRCCAQPDYGGVGVGLALHSSGLQKCGDGNPSPYGGAVIEGLGIRRAACILRRSGIYYWWAKARSGNSASYRSGS